GPRLQEMLASLRQQREPVAEGPEDFLAALVQRPAPAVPDATLPEALSPKERQILELVGQGLTNDAMAARLFISESTVRTHLRNINTKLHANNRMHAVAIARQLQLIP